VIWYGLGPDSGLRARVTSALAVETRFLLSHEGKEAEIRTPLIGRHNVYNCLAAAGACLGLGMELPAVAAAVGGVDRVPGRLERVKVAAPYQVFVDYAHTDDALANVLGAMRPVTKGRLIVVFGCGGDRDRTKRPRMAKVAEAMADVVFVTSDNPRTERPQDILEEILAGFSDEGRRRAAVLPDRKTAIETAVAEAKAGDVVLLAGKGHENYQIIGKEKHPFDDVEVARDAMIQRGSRA
jgi:UDP-N-acetylmuramoyl-L-alanyl-D-glutamate--2,6-diaminopimelate ligase